MSKTINKYFDGLTWNDIVWSDSYDIVRRIQKRIYKASRLNEKGKVRFLQKLVLGSPHAKLIAVQTVTTLNLVPVAKQLAQTCALLRWHIKGKKTDGLTATSSEEKLKMAKTLQLNGKANFVRKVEKRPLGIPTIQDRAKQALAKLALEPEWEAKFEPNSYGFRPGRNAQDAIEAIYSNLHFDVDKYVFDADIRKCFDKINHKALLEKLQTFPLMESQIEAWLKAGIFYLDAEKEKLSYPGMGTPQGGVISPLLANIALHGLENHLLDFVSNQKMPKPHTGAARGTKAKRTALGIVRYADDFVIIHRNKEIIELVIQETKNWLSKVGLEISEEKSALKLASQSFQFLGFQIAYTYNLVPVAKQLAQTCALLRWHIKVSKRFRVKITPSKENVLNILNKTRTIIQNNKAASAYQLIGKLRPVLLGWANFFKYCECKEKFARIDNLVYQQLRAWVFRRAVRQGRIEVKENYFPSEKSYLFQGRTYNGNWILNGSKKSTNGKPISIYLPKISWISSQKHIKIKGDASVYDGNEMYWALRTPRSCALPVVVVAKQLQLQLAGKHIKGGKDTYSNLQ